MIQDFLDYAHSGCALKTCIHPSVPHSMAIPHLMWFCNPCNVDENEETWEKAMRRRKNREGNKQLALERLEWEKEITSNHSCEEGVAEKENTKIVGKHNGKTLYLTFMKKRGID